MVKLTKIYTKGGDKGQTSLAAGRPIAKGSVRINTIGEVDELNAALGLAVMSIQALPQLKTLALQCFRIQNELFNLGSQLAVLLQDRRANTPVIQNANVDLLEKEIDEMNTVLPALNSFVLPGGSEVS